MCVCAHVYVYIYKHKHLYVYILYIHIYNLYVHACAYAVLASFRIKVFQPHYFDALTNAFISCPINKPIPAYRAIFGPQMNFLKLNVALFVLYVD